MAADALLARFPVALCGGGAQHRVGAVAAQPIADNLPHATLVPLPSVPVPAYARARSRPFPLPGQSSRPRCAHRIQVAVRTPLAKTALQPNSRRMPLCSVRLHFGSVGGAFCNAYKGDEAQYCRLQRRRIKTFTRSIPRRTYLPLLRGSSLHYAHPVELGRANPVCSPAVAELNGVSPVPAQMWAG